MLSNSMKNKNRIIKKAGGDNEFSPRVQAVEREQVDSIQPKLQHVNAVGQGLIQSAAKDTDTQALEHDLESTNLQWNSLNKRVGDSAQCDLRRCSSSALLG